MTTSIRPAPPGAPATSVLGLVESHGYTEAEWFVSGLAGAHVEAGTWSSDGRWTTTTAEVDVPFTTRILVAAPVDPAAANGTVWVEWLNVSAGMDGVADLVQARDHIVTSGATWVGVSAQTVGTDTLAAQPDGRYAELEMRSDAYSYDVFAEVATFVRAHPEILGGERVERLLAVGTSQSALRLTTYINAWHERSPVFDGYVVHSRFTTGAPVGEGMMGAVPTRIRDDIGVPVFQLETEIDVNLSLEALVPGLGSWSDVRQPNAGNVHTWEVAGASHADAYQLEGAGALPGALSPCGTPVNDFPMHWAACAAFAALERWVEDGERPASTLPIEMRDGRVVRDADGNACGGLRLPDIDLPLAWYNAEVDTADPLCVLFGSTAPMPAATLRSRYATVDGYVEAYRALADIAVAAGIMPARDVERATASAAAVAAERFSSERHVTDG